MIFKDATLFFIKKKKFATEKKSNISILRIKLSTYFKIPSLFVDKYCLKLFTRLNWKYDVYRSTVL